MIVWDDGRTTDDPPRLKEKWSDGSKGTTQLNTGFGDRHSFDSILLLKDVTIEWSYNDSSSHSIGNSTAATGPSFLHSFNRSSLLTGFWFNPTQLLFIWPKVKEKVNSTVMDWKRMSKRDHGDDEGEKRNGLIFLKRELNKNTVRRKDDIMRWNRGTRIHEKQEMERFARIHSNGHLNGERSSSKYLLLLSSTSSGSSPSNSSLSLGGNARNDRLLILFHDAVWCLLPYNRVIGLLWSSSWHSNSRYDQTHRLTFWLTHSLLGYPVPNIESPSFHQRWTDGLISSLLIVVQSKILKAPEFPQLFSWIFSFIAIHSLLSV